MGSPSIQGGMTAAEQRDLLQEERDYQDAQEKKRRAQALADEEERRKRDEAERIRLAQDELQRIGEINKAEQAVIAEATAAEKKTSKSDMAKVSFYDALSKGVVNKPTTVEKPK